MKEVSVSFLKDGDYKEYIKIINNSNADYIHYDVMDGKFTENKNLSPKELISLIDLSKKKNDVHLMVKNPRIYIEKLALTNVNNITIHYEIKDLNSNLNLIKSYGIRAGIAINPDTDIEKIYNYLDKIDIVLIMGVVPGKSGQKFLDETENRINQLKQYIKDNNLSTKIEIDGGVTTSVLDKIKNTDIVVSCSYVLDNLDNINLIKKQGS